MQAQTSGRQRAWTTAPRAAGTVQTRTPCVLRASSGRAAAPLPSYPSPLQRSPACQHAPGRRAARPFAGRAPQRPGWPGSPYPCLLRPRSSPSLAPHSPAPAAAPPPASYPSLKIQKKSNMRPNMRPKKLFWAFFNGFLRVFVCPCLVRAKTVCGQRGAMCCDQRHRRVTVFSATQEDLPLPSTGSAGVGTAAFSPSVSAKKGSRGRGSAEQHLQAARLCRLCAGPRRALRERAWARAGRDLRSTAIWVAWASHRRNAKRCSAAMVAN